MPVPAPVVPDPVVPDAVADSAGAGKTGVSPVVAADLIPLLSIGVNQKRIERLRQTLRRTQAKEITALVQYTDGTPDGKVTAAGIAADIMGVSERYVADALRLQREDPKAFEEVRAGKLTLKAAIRQLTAAPADAEQAEKARELRNRVNVLIKRAALDAARLAELGQVVASLEERWSGK